jgi:hypothetical protein
MTACGTEGDLRPSGNYGRNRRDFCRGSQAVGTRSGPSAAQSQCYWTIKSTQRYAAGRAAGALVLALVKLIGKLRRKPAAAAANEPA